MPAVERFAQARKALQLKYNRLFKVSDAPEPLTNYVDVSVFIHKSSEYSYFCGNCIVCTVPLYVAGYLYADVIIPALHSASAFS